MRLLSIKLPAGTDIYIYDVSGNRIAHSSDGTWEGQKGMGTLWECQQRGLYLCPFV